MALSYVRQVIVVPPLLVITMIYGHDTLGIGSGACATLRKGTNAIQMALSRSNGYIALSVSAAKGPSAPPWKARGKTRLYDGGQEISVQSDLEARPRLIGPSVRERDPS